MSNTDNRPNIVVVDDHITEILQFHDGVQPHDMAATVYYFWLPDPDEASFTEFVGVSRRLRERYNNAIRLVAHRRAGLGGCERLEQYDQTEDAPPFLSSSPNDVVDEVLELVRSDEDRRWVVICDVRIESFSAEACKDVEADPFQAGFWLAKRLAHELPREIRAGRVLVGLASRSSRIDLNRFGDIPSAVRVFPKYPPARLREAIAIFTSMGPGALPDDKAPELTGKLRFGAGEISNAPIWMVVIAMAGYLCIQVVSLLSLAGR